MRNFNYCTNCGKKFSDEDENRPYDYFCYDCCPPYDNMIDGCDDGKVHCVKCGIELSLDEANAFGWARYICDDCLEVENDFYNEEEDV